MMAKDIGKMFDPDLFPRFERVMRDDRRCYQYRAAARAIAVAS